MKRTTLLTLLAFAFGMLPDCNKYSAGKRPQLELEIDGDWMFLEYEPAFGKQEDEDCPDGWDAVSDILCCPTGTMLGANDFCYEKYGFPTVHQGQPAKQVVVSLWNAGRKDLTIEEIYLEEEGNPYINLDWQTRSIHKPEDLPISISPDLPAAGLEFLVVYAPETGMVDISSRVLVIKTNHPKFEGKPYFGEYRMIFTVESVGPKIQVDKTKINYGCVTGCSPAPITIDNEGTDTLTIKAIQFAKPAAEFSITNPPALPIDIATKGDPDYNPLTFSVMYCPADSEWDDTNTLEVVCNDPTVPGNMLSIPVEVNQAPAALDFSTDSEFLYLDFSEEETHKVNIHNKPASECDHLCGEAGKCCGCSINIQGIDFDPVDAGDWYSVVAKDPTTGDELSIPRALKGGSSIEFEVSYQKPAGQSGDKNGTMCVRYLAPLAGAQDYCVKLISKSECEFSIGPPSRLLDFNYSTVDPPQKPALLINSGNAPCTVSHVNVTDKFGNVSDHFELAEVFTGGTEVPPFSQLPVWVIFSPGTTTEDDFTGKMKSQYEDDMIGEVVDEYVSLKGHAADACALPVAVPGQGYTAVAGEMFNLDGCTSSAGNCGADIFSNGYIWILLDKPEESTTALSVEGGCLMPFLPDRAGTYEIGLIVFDEETFYQSELATTTVEVSAE